MVITQNLHVLIITLDLSWIYLSTAVTLSENLERDLSNDLFKSKILLGPKLVIFGLGPYGLYNRIGPIPNYEHIDDNYH